MFNYKEQRQILRYKDYSLTELLQENTKSYFPITVKVASYISSYDTSFLNGVGASISSELHSEPQFLRTFLVENIKENVFPKLHFKELLQLIYLFCFTKESIKKAITCVVLETQYQPYSFLSEIAKYDVSFIISKLKFDISCAKLKEHLFNMAKKDNKLDLLFASPFFYLDGYEIQSFGVPERYVISYIESMNSPRSEIDKIAFDSILKRGL
jgi:hypothetical protein